MGLAKMLNLRNVTFKNGRQTLALCIVWGALAASAGLCLAAPVNALTQPVTSRQELTRLSAIMISLAANGL